MMLFPLTFTIHNFFLCLVSLLGTYILLKNTQNLRKLVYASLSDTCLLNIKIDMMLSHSKTVTSKKVIK